MPNERREQKRFSLNLQARISYRHIEDQSQVFDTVAANISSSGAYLETAHPFPMAAKVKVEFFVSLADLTRLRFILSVESLRKLSQLPEQNIWVEAHGIVIRREQKGVGIIFDTDYQLTAMQPPGAVS